MLTLDVSLANWSGEYKYRTGSWRGASTIMKKEQKLVISVVVQETDEKNERTEKQRDASLLLLALVLAYFHFSAPFHPQVIIITRSQGNRHFPWPQHANFKNLGKRPDKNSWLSTNAERDQSTKNRICWVNSLIFLWASNQWKSNSSSYMIREGLLALVFNSSSTVSIQWCHNGEGKNWSKQNEGWLTPLGNYECVCSKDWLVGSWVPSPQSGQPPT